MSVALRVPRLVVLVSAASLAACGPALRQMADDENRRDQASVAQRAEFDLACPAARLTIVGLSHWRNDPDASFNQYGVTGCDRRAVYVETDSGWVLNTTSADAP